jgi:hypothetical protein
MCACVSAPAWAACPKLLMTSGAFIWQQTNPQQAAYWGQTVGVQGFMLNEVMRDWDSDVGTDPDSKLWKLVRQFQLDYSQYGVTDNYITVALHTQRDWRNPMQNDAVVRNFAHVAALAKYAGFKGVDLDLEPYKPTWNGGWDLADTVQQEGRAIGQAMHDAYPDMTLVIEKDALHEAFQLNQPLTALANPQGNPPDTSKRFHGGYQLSVPFLRGLLSVDWARVVVATEETYKDPDVVNVVKQTASNYGAFLGDGAVWSNLSVAPGLWPLGLSKWDKSARETPQEFKDQLKTAFGVSKDYVWIYAYGSAWQTNGPYGPGPVTANFKQYTDAIHQVIATCGADGSAPPAADPSGAVPQRPVDTPAYSGIGAGPDTGADTGWTSDGTDDDAETPTAAGTGTDSNADADPGAQTGSLPRVKPVRPADLQSRPGTLPHVEPLHALQPWRN